MTAPLPPQPAQFALRLLLPTRDRDTILGDLIQEYRERIYPERGEVAANCWFVRQVLSYYGHAQYILAVLLSASMVSRTIFDWYAPPSDFYTRSMISTWVAIPLVSAMGFVAVWRSGRGSAGPSLAIVTTLVAALLTVTASGVLLVLGHDAATLTAAENSGGLGEVFTLPFMAMAPAAILGTLGGWSAMVLRRFGA